MRSLGDVARALYGVTPAEFLDARGAEAAAALDQGDRTLATRIRSLRKPTVAAWAVNALVRERPDEVDALLHLGERMREATADLDREALQTLGRERQRLLSGIARAAREVGDEVEVAVSEAAATAVQTTFQAAVSDPSAAAAVRSGLLVRTLAADGIDPAELAGSMAIAVAALPPLGSGGSDGSGAGDTDGSSGSADRSRTKRGAGSTSAPTRPGADDRARERAREREQERERAREAARREAEDAQQQADAAAAELAGLEARIRDNHDDHERLTGDLRRLRRELDELQDAVTEAKTAGAALRRERQAAVRASDAARRAATRARQSLDRLP
ncbi:hypothetical protein [Herbiconiux sp. YIM B11900]|uniref:hypothetical protein n=1 Tax=Herbiconiux sp. YIM B11900 TaxID=3404131 RepID=UPI003F8281FC